MYIMSKLPNVTTSIFTVMSKMASEYNAINLSQGFPNFPVDERLTDIVARLSKENVHQYTPMAGYPPLMNKIAKLIKDSYKRTINPDLELLVTAGATQGIFTTILALVKENDEVIILDPSYDSYESPVLLCKAKPVRVALNDDYTPNWETIEKACSEKSRMIIINNPHNPTGKILTENDFIQLKNLLEKYPDIIVLSDEVYEYITFEEKHISAHTKDFLLDRCVMVSSFGKSFHITGWKIGYCVASKEITEAFRSIHQYLTFSVNTPAQYALAKYLEVYDPEEAARSLQAKRDLLIEGLKSSSLRQLPVCTGTYFQLYDYSAISDLNDVEFAQWLTVDHKVATIPLSAFYKRPQHDQVVRFCFAKKDEVIEKATHILRSITG